MNFRYKPAMDTGRGAAVTIGGVFLLFTIWSASFIAIEELVTEGRFDWLSLTVARFAPVAVLCGTYLLWKRRRETIDVLRRHWWRVSLCGLFAVPGYNFALYSGQQQRVPAPVASLITALAPLFLMILSALFLAERITARRVVGFLISVGGLTLIARARDTGGEVPYPALIALTTLAPLSWSCHSVLTKPVANRVSPLVWTYLAVVIGTVPLLPLLPFAGLPEMAALDAAGWGFLGYLSLLCTVVGFALWTWLLSRVRASTMGFTIFLNPPLTTAYKYVLAAALPAVFAFTVAPEEVLGGLVVLAGLGVAVLRIGK